MNLGDSTVVFGDNGEETNGKITLPALSVVVGAAVVSTEMN